MAARSKPSHDGPTDPEPLVLVVDDDKQMLELLEMLLSRAGYAVHAEESAVKALDWLNKETPGAVVLDIMMPERSGIEVLEHIRWNPKLADLPVIVLSAVHPTQDEREFIQNFAQTFVEKTHIKDVLIHLKTIYRGKRPSPVRLV
jgi:CheY-like chemotaxis protein